MNHYTITKLTLDQVRDLYRRSTIYDFPDNERKPLSMIETSIAAGRYDCFGLTNGSDILAYAYYVTMDSTYLMDYFAVLNNYRNQGIGSQFLQQLNVLHKQKTVITEIEDPDYADTEYARAIRNRRRNFYINNGFRDTGIHVRLFGVDYRLLVFEQDISRSANDVLQRYQRIYRAMLPSRVYERQIRI